MEILKSELIIKNLFGLIGPRWGGAMERVKRLNKKVKKLRPRKPLIDYYYRGP
jgi:hypothetical protein